MGFGASCPAVAEHQTIIARPMSVSFGATGFFLQFSLSLSHRHTAGYPTLKLDVDHVLVMFSLPDALEAPAMDLLWIRIM
jgi:hypothetical protein